MLPLLAESWDVSADGLIFTFKLRNGVRWHDVPPVNGRPFTSADVAYSIDYHVDLANGSMARAFWLGAKHIEPDARTVVVTLQERNADFMEDRGHFQNIMIPREVKDLPGG